MLSEAWQKRSFCTYLLGQGWLAAPEVEGQCEMHVVSATKMVLDESRILPLKVFLEEVVSCKIARSV